MFYALPLLGVVILVQWVEVVIRVLRWRAPVVAFSADRPTPGGALHFGGS